ncbi:MAG: glycosyltransferase family 4 protein [Chloracidobacterium sp.]|nr:glycosyltransferase family 4 protein [Chloracidobacterium sp.]MDW8218635.1 glycosyltransferase family 4 protein [Acidobacteriota bacterium]
MNVLLVHPGTQHAFQLARQLARQGLLGGFWTGLALREEAWWVRWLSQSAGVRERLGNRLLAGVPRNRLHLQPWRELAALWAVRRGKPALDVFLTRNARFQRAVPLAALRAAGAVIGFDTSSWILAERCRELGKPFILDQSIAHPLWKKQVLEAVAARYPDWRETVVPPPPEMLAHEQKEHELATAIVVAGSFTKRSLLAHGVPEGKVMVNPYGVDLDAFTPRSAREEGRPFRFLFLGSLTARKGLPLLLEVWRKLAARQAELWLVGPVAPAVRRLIPDLPGLSVLGKRPHRDLPDLIRRCDVLVFPSYFEGFGLVVLEAMACGVPVIASDATAGPDVIEDGVDGWLMAAGDAERLQAVMEAALTRPDQTFAMGRLARRKAEAYTWETYGLRWKTLLERVLDSPNH